MIKQSMDGKRIAWTNGAGTASSEVLVASVGEDGSLSEETKVADSACHPRFSGLGLLHFLSDVSVSWAGFCVTTSGRACTEMNCVCICQDSTVHAYCYLRKDCTRVLSFKKQACMRFVIEETIVQAHCLLRINRTCLPFLTDTPYMHAVAQEITEDVYCCS